MKAADAVFRSETAAAEAGDTKGGRELEKRRTDAGSGGDGSDGSGDADLLLTREYHIEP